VALSSRARERFYLISAEYSHRKTQIIWSRSVRRREVIIVLATMLGTRAAFGQNAARKRVIGVLMGARNDAEGQARGSVFEDALRASGWRSGENITIEYRWAAGDPNLVRTHAAELVGMKPDVILSDGTSATAGLREATNTIPVVFVQVTDPIGTGLFQVWPSRAAMSQDLATMNSAWVGSGSTSYGR